MKEKIEDYLNESKEILELLQDVDIEKVVDILKNSDNIYIAGNGGSSATASHLANDFQKISKLKTYCLTDNTPLLTAWSNDTDYDIIFQPQLKLLASNSDTLIVLSGSGDSLNIFYAVSMAKSIGMNVIAFLGGDGGMIKEKFKDINIIHIPSDMQHAEDWHLVLGHILCMVIRK